MKKLSLIITIIALFVISACGVKQQAKSEHPMPEPILATSHIEQEKNIPAELGRMIDLLVENEDVSSNTGGMSITYPYSKSVLPPEIAAITFQWKDDNAQVSSWLLRFEFQSGQAPVYAISNTSSWTPPKQMWEQIKRHSVFRPTTFSVIGFSEKNESALRSFNKIDFSFSKDKVDALILFRQVPLPFQKGENYLKKMKWRLGDISSYKAPKVVMEKMSTCASCHSGSKDGALLSMEMNYNGDSGAQFVKKVAPRMELSKKDFMSWNDFPRPEILPKTRGLFARMSPSGRYIISTAHEISYMALTNDPAFSQLFFPTHGILAWYDIPTRTFYRLPGADDHQFIQTGPAWSPDEREIIFSRADTHNHYHHDIMNVSILQEDKSIEQLNQELPIQFDLYRLPFNGGNGGTPEPLNGASLNGMSNYFPRYSPNGKWIVFTQSPTGIMLQPDSNLYILPAAGGKARKMTCNRGRFNSWHSWSPNGKWLLFSSKVNSMYTDVFLTHIDNDGKDSPPVCLSRFSEASYAVNVPEFLNISPNAIENIVVGKR